MKTQPEIEWTPFPGHWSGQHNEKITYVSGEYRGFLVSLYENIRHARWDWSFYRSGGDINDLPVSAGSEVTRDEAEAEMFDYINGMLPARENLRWTVDINVDVVESSVVMDAFVKFKNELLEEGSRINALILWGSIGEGPVLDFRNIDYRGDDDE